jgi:hypothetical protein
MAKLFFRAIVMQAPTEVIQVFSGHSYVMEYNVERFFRDLKILEISEGITEIQNLIISKDIISTIKGL